MKSVIPKILIIFYCFIAVECVRKLKLQDYVHYSRIPTNPGLHIDWQQWRAIFQKKNDSYERARIRTPCNIMLLDKPTADLKVLNPQTMNWQDQCVKGQKSEIILYQIAEYQKGFSYPFPLSRCFKVKTQGMFSILRKAVNVPKVLSFFDDKAGRTLELLDLLTYAPEYLSKYFEFNLLIPEEMVDTITMDFEGLEQIWGMVEMVSVDFWVIKFNYCPEDKPDAVQASFISQESISVPLIDVSNPNYLHVFAMKNNCTLEEPLELVFDYGSPGTVVTLTEKDELDDMSCSISPYI